MAKTITAMNIIHNVGESVFLVRYLNKYKTAFVSMGVTVSAVSEKAIQVSSTDTKIKVWYPRAALIAEMDENANVKGYTVAKWFDGSEFHVKFEQAVGYFHV